MRLVETSLPGVLRIEPTVHRDERGFFLEVHHERKFAEAGLDVRFVQDNHSSSRGGTLRGLHLQTVEPQGKLVRCIEGTIWDVAVDVRPGSVAFGRWVGVELSAASFRQVWIPPGFAHGFCVLSPVAQVEYKCTTHYRPEADLSIRWNDPAFAIDWPVEAPRLSAKDAAAPGLDEVRDRLAALAV